MGLSDLTATEWVILIAFVLGGVLKIVGALVDAEEHRKREGLS